jgi:hypothetical protein
MAKKFENLGKVENMGGLSSLITDSSKPVSLAHNNEPIKTYTVKTFNITPDDFTYIKKYVKYRRMQGDTEFTQKEALEEAIGLLRKNTPDLK